MTSYIVKNTTSGRYEATDGSEYLPGGTTGPVTLGTEEVKRMQAAGLTVTVAGGLSSEMVAIVTTGTAVPFPAAPLVNGATVKASKTNTASTNTVTGAVGNASVSNVNGGAGNGYALAPGDSTPLLAVSDASQIYVNGTAGDVFSYVGT